MEQRFDVPQPTLSKEFQLILQKSTPFLFLCLVVSATSESLLLKVHDREAKLKELV